MLDIKIIRENAAAVDENLRRRGDKESRRRLRELLVMDKERRETIQKIENMRHKRNILTKEISELKRKKKPIQKKIKEVKGIPDKIRASEKKLQEIEMEYNNILLRLPNILHETVPFGKNDNDNKEVRTVGVIPSFDFTPKDHIDLGVKLDIIDIERAAKISGARFYFIKGELALLEMALMKFGIDFIMKKGFTLSIPPYMIKRSPYEGVTDLADFENVLYKIEDEDLYMIATSEHPLISQYMNETIEEKELPLLIAGYSANFRKEAGTHGKDTKGIFRVHQFNKIEQIVLCKPQDSWEWHEKLTKNTEEFFQLLEIPFRVVNVCTGDIGIVAAKKYDLEAWMPAQKKYREMGSCSNCTDYQARRLNIKYREKEGVAPKGVIHTLNSTLVTDRALVAIMENNQQSDGSFLVPAVLQPYMNDIKKIG